MPTQIWLASRSPRRLELLQTLGLQVRVFLAQNSPEAEALEAPFENEDPLLYVQRVTQLKLNAALAAMRMQQLSGLVLAADTTVALNGTILGKPQNDAEAFQMLRSLSNTTHQVHTAVAGAWLNAIGRNTASKNTVQTSHVEFATLPETFIHAYIASGEPFDKAGAYGIQGIAGQYVRHISGSHSGIMGLPLFETSELMRHIQTAA
ncbi:Maf family protein [Limnobacter sp. YS8-69]|uniref:dTTP/UTP pyrophosphatase n=2 Tax=Limnobacter parvus TaxID=2939690 RepID=A0ABT1XES3_9BURK|nr:Maf family protein [Limnobacter parvus]